jgi:hypothetical protein
MRAAQDNSIEIKGGLVVHDIAAYDFPAIGPA